MSQKWVVLSWERFHQLNNHHTPTKEENLMEQPNREDGERLKESVAKESLSQPVPNTETTVQSGEGGLKLAAEKEADPTVDSAHGPLLQTPKPPGVLASGWLRWKN